MLSFNQMPRRKIPLVNGEIYHVFNRGIDHRTTFSSTKEYQRALITILFYQLQQIGYKITSFFNLQKTSQQQIISNLSQSPKNQVLGYCLMSNHFHLLLRQEIDNGISSHLKEFQNSYTRYFNLRHNRTGPLFSTQFKAVRIETENQFLHVSRYIHLNPYSSKIIKSKNEIFTYPWSSAHIYTDQKPTISTNHYPFLNETLLGSHFQTKKHLRQFTLDNTDHQRHLKQIQHLALE
jgi:putative transposase